MFLWFYAKNAKVECMPCCEYMLIVRIAKRHIEEIRIDCQLKSVDIKVYNYIQL